MQYWRERLAATRDHHKNFLIVLGVVAVVINSIFVTREPEIIPISTLSPSQPLQPVEPKTIVPNDQTQKQIRDFETQSDARQSPFSIFQQKTIPDQPPAESPEEIRRRKELEEEAALKAKAEKHRQYLAKYIKRNEGRISRPILAISVTDAEDRANFEFSQELADRLKSDAFQVTTSFFNPDFIRDGLQEELFNGSNELADKLELRGRLAGLILAKEHVRYTDQGSSLAHVITASMTLEMRVISLGDTIADRSWTYEAAGAGFNNEVARKNAEERLSKKFTNVTTAVISK